MYTKIVFDFKENCYRKQTCNSFTRKLFFSPMVLYYYLKEKYNAECVILTAMFDEGLACSNVITDSNIVGITTAFFDNIKKSKLKRMFFSIKYVKDGKDVYETFDETYYSTSRRGSDALTITDPCMVKALQKSIQMGFPNPMLTTEIKVRGIVYG